MKLSRGASILSGLPCVSLDDDALMDVRNIVEGAFDPLKGFMDSRDYGSVVSDMHLRSGAAWTIPITLAVDEDQAGALPRAGRAVLQNAAGAPVAVLTVSDVFKIDAERDVAAVYGTTELRHPGVARELSRGCFRVGGPIEPLPGAEGERFPAQMTVAQVRQEIARRGWKTVVGFQTRNAPHRAHEHLQRLGLEFCDGLLIHPLVGWKKADDFAPDAVVRAYQKLIKEFYRPERVLFSVLRTAMRYAGPREAIFHAIIRRNYGCTHFMIGRDHAGVGGFYGKYAGHELADRLPDLGIKILKMCGPYFCKRCDQVVTERTCPHGETFAVEISGTDVRKMITGGRRPPVEFMRPEISDLLIDMAKRSEVFCGVPR